MVEPVGSKMAYMAVPGNHELDIYDSTNENGTIYTKRFIMPGQYILLVCDSNQIRV